MKPDFRLWIQKHDTPETKCDFCDLIHNDYKEYSVHLESDHPQEWDQFLSYYTLNGRGA